MRQEPHVSDFLRFFVFDAESFADFCNVLFKFFHSIRIESMMFYIILDVIQATLRGLYSQRMYEILMIKQKKKKQGRIHGRRCYETPFSAIEEKVLQTYGRTDGRT